LSVDPGVKRGLGFFNQHDPRKSGALRRGDSKLARNFVKEAEW
jgi:hypothetical protein